MNSPFHSAVLLPGQMATTAIVIEAANTVDFVNIS
jgi:hypothetical protein